MRKLSYSGFNEVQANLAGIVNGAAESYLPGNEALPGLETTCICLQSVMILVKPLGRVEIDKYRV